MSSMALISIILNLWKISTLLIEQLNCPIIALYSAITCSLTLVLKICQFVFHAKWKNTEHFILIESVNTL